MLVHIGEYQCVNNTFQLVLWPPHSSMLVIASSQVRNVQRKEEKRKVCAVRRFNHAIDQRRPIPDMPFSVQKNGLRFVDRDIVVFTVKGVVIMSV